MTSSVNHTTNFRPSSARSKHQDQPAVFHFRNQSNTVSLCNLQESSFISKIDGVKSMTNAATAVQRKTSIKHDQLEMDDTAARVMSRMNVGAKTSA